MRYLYRGILSSRRPVRKQPSMEPRELSIRRKEIWPRLTPTYSTVQYSTVQYSTVQYSTVQVDAEHAAVHHLHVYHVSTRGN